MTMEEIISKVIEHSGTWTLLGVCVGFGFTEISFRLKKAKERKECKVALIDEIRFNHAHTLNKIDIVEQAIKTLSEQKFMSTKCGCYSTTEFDSLFHIAVPILTVIEKDNFRHLHSFYRRIDALLDEFDSIFRNDIDSCDKRNATIESVYQGHLTQLTDIHTALKDSLQLSENLVAGKPIDIFEAVSA